MVTIVQVHREQINSSITELLANGLELSTSRAPITQSTTMDRLFIERIPSENGTQPEWGQTVPSGYRLPHWGSHLEQICKLPNNSLVNQNYQKSLKALKGRQSFIHHGSLN